MISSWERRLQIKVNCLRARVNPNYQEAHQKWYHYRTKDGHYKYTTLLHLCSSLWNLRKKRWENSLVKWEQTTWVGKTIFIQGIIKQSTIVRYYHISSIVCWCNSNTHPTNREHTPHQPRTHTPPTENTHWLVALMGACVCGMCVYVRYCMCVCGQDS